MQVVGGPSGSGKSRTFPVAEANPRHHFNVDDRCNELQGSYKAIPPDIRQRANKECEAFIAEHIHSRTGFAVETTLRSDITFRQAAEARAAGFRVTLQYIGTGNIEENVARVAERGRRGGHSASPGKIREIYAASMANLPRAIREFDYVRVYDNTQRTKGSVRLVLEALKGRVKYVAPDTPDWVRGALRGTEYERALPASPAVAPGRAEKALDALSQKALEVAQKAGALSPETAAKAAKLSGRIGDATDVPGKGRGRGAGPER